MPAHQSRLRTPGWRSRLGHLWRRHGGYLSKVVLGLSIASLAMLIWVATRSWPIGWLYGMLAAYGALSLGWAALRFWNGGLTTSLPARVGSGLSVAGVIALAVYHHDKRADALSVIGLVLIYAGLGWLVEWLRRQDWALRSGTWLLAGGLVVACGAAVGLANSSSRGYWPLLVLLAAAVLLAVPIGLNLVSEAVLRRVARPSGRVGFGLLPAEAAATVGATVAVLVVVVTGVLSHSWAATLIVSGVTVVLMAAIVSDTHLDVAIVICTLCLLAAGPPQVPVPPALDQGVGPSTLVALGDSYMSGEGAATFYAHTDDPGIDECRRSPTAFAARTVQAHLFDHVTFLACSGARTYNLIPTPAGAKPDNQVGENGTQLDQLQQLRRKYPSFRPTLAIITIGGNDAGFATLGEACLAPGNCTNIRDRFEGTLPAVRDALDATYTSVRQVLPDVPVVAVPYPQPIAAGQCSGLLLDPKERTFVHDFVDSLDRVVHEEATKQGFYYLDTMESALADGHAQLCDPANHGRPGIYPIAVKGVNGVAMERFSPVSWLHNSLHPNAFGHSTMLAAFTKWLAAHPPGTLKPPGRPLASAAVGPVAVSVATRPKPPCSFTTTGPSNCSTQARNWEISQLGRLWPWAIMSVVGLIAVWLLSVGVLGLVGRTSPRRMA